MKKLLALAGVLVAALVLVTVAGSWMEPRHVVSRTRRFAASPERVWTALLSIRQLPFDRSDLKEMERALDKNRVPASIEVLGAPVRIEAPIVHPPAELLVKTTEEGLAYSGTWRFTLSPENDDTLVAVTEDAEIHSRPLRFVVGHVLGEDVLIEGVFRALTRKLSEAPRTTGGD
ncbi:MAG: SRPBCC domain-containing protein [Thermoanaerobaculia bacterium]